MKKIKKYILFLLLHPIIGRLVKKFKIPINFFGGRFDYSIVSDIDAARIFWGLWESQEIRYAKRFAKTKTIIELGSSIGVTLGVLSNIRDKTKFICVEGSSNAFNKLISQKRNFKTTNSYEFINKVIAYGCNNILFGNASLRGSRIYKDFLRKGIRLPKSSISKMPTITLCEIINFYKVKGPFTLITDIEGMEAEIFFHDAESLQNCQCIIAELENTYHYSINDQIKKLTDIGFKLEAFKKNVAVFLR